MESRKSNETNFNNSSHVYSGGIRLEIIYGELDIGLSAHSRILNHTKNKRSVLIGLLFFCLIFASTSSQYSGPSVYHLSLLELSL